MSESPNYLKKWRLHRGFTQAQVLDRLAILEDNNLPRTGASLSRLENGKQPWSKGILEALSDIYDCDASDLIGHDPTKEGKVIDLVHRLSEKQLAQAYAVLEALANTG